MTHIPPQALYDFSVVIPCKNEQANIGRLLSAIREQTIYQPGTEIIIADANSTDDTLYIIDEHRAAFAMNIIVVEGGYPAAGRNRGAAYANGKYIIFMDADILPANNRFFEDVMTLALAKDLDCVASFIKAVDGDWRDRLFWNAHNVIISIYPLFGPFAAGMFMCFRKVAFHLMGGFDERIILGEDFDLTHRVPRNKFGVVRNFILNSNRRFARMGYFKTIYMYTRVAFSRDYRLSDHRSYFEV